MNVIAMHPIDEKPQPGPSEQPACDTYMGTGADSNPPDKWKHGLPRTRLFPVSSSAGLAQLWCAVDATAALSHHARMSMNRATTVAVNTTATGGALRMRVS